ncbi:class I SAM-dependent methyltransferase [Pseudoalteromonas sp. Of7M-16]|uniref:class I SAM-dependent methyltransferase n=1 Tax=Pseudoalteromonas sp. Of7M-16 TaxID=2917756 RepID=UPI001EF5E7D2|nr:class I SAM-dependent methyltransferase [Pseudoalteromonas sp. Of7M-16]MCG7547576.1 class I SAM-dependent methyltransferase [Pseudoalteromonas sp. Of7M-16]
MTAQYYEQNALKLAQIYQTDCFESLHANWLTHLKPYLVKEHLSFLDIGAGAGRDAKFIVEQNRGAEVVAVEPVSSINRLGQAYTRELPIIWFRDELPRLVKVKKQYDTFDIILVSGVFNYLDSHACIQALLTIRQLLKPQGLLVIKLRHCTDEQHLELRGLTNFDTETLVTMAQSADLSLEFITDKEQDAQGRAHTTWQTLLFRPI